MNRVLILVILVALLSVATPFKAVAQERFRIMEYNVENLFDTIPSKQYADEEFTPCGSRKWDSPRYWAKQGRLARVIAAAGGDTPVELVGLIEVENDTVLHHLTRRTFLARLGYEYLLTDGPDVRGINVALLYQPGRFLPTHHEGLRIPTIEGQRPTRDVLFVEGLLPTLDTLSVFVTHFPSRRGGKHETEAHRCRVAQVIRHKVDSILKQRPCALIVVMGDMNDEVQDESLKNMLQVKPAHTDDFTEGALYDVLPKCVEHKEITGTYYYQQEWSCIDHIIVSGAFLAEDASMLASKFCRILAYPFLLTASESKFPTTYRPKRNYLGPFYQGGFSDHLPLLLEFTVKR